MSFGDGNLRERCAELEHMVETRDESIRNLVKLLDKRQGRTEELEQLVRDMYVELVKDTMYVKPDGTEFRAPWADEYLAPIEKRMAALGIEVDK